MSQEQAQTREILGRAKTVRELLGGAKYAIDYYQREFKWGTDQVKELIEDLAGRFLRDFDPEHERGEVANYGHYFLGSIIISQKQGHNYIVDGQQRLTTLTLLLIDLHHLGGAREDDTNIEELIFSTKYGSRSFNLDVEERADCMDALFKDEPFDETDESESVRNIVARYADIREFFPEELTGKALPYFADWLMEKVHLVEITAHSDDDAYTIFETMNDRGLSLSATDMLRGYLLANISHGESRDSANDVWKQRMGALLKLEKDEPSDFLKAWLRGQYARNIRERKKDAVPGDFDRIGSEFHRWVRDNHESLGLLRSADFARFIERDMAFYGRQYLRLRTAAENLASQLENVFHIAQRRFTLQYPVLLAPLLPEDPQDDIERKLRIVAAYLDILLARRMCNWRSIDYSTMQYAMFLLMRDIRRKSVPELAQLLRQRLDEDKEDFANNPRFQMTQMNRPTMLWLLARMTDHIERESGMPSRYLEYTTGRGSRRYEVEHIWSDNPERHTDEFPYAGDFQEYRNLIGGLLILPKSFNASYGDLPYEEKHEHYNTQNLLARSLHEQCYERNPGFLQYVQRSGLPFGPHPEFKRADLDARQELYRQLAEEIWDPDRLEREAAS